MDMLDEDELSDQEYNFPFFLKKNLSNEKNIEGL